MNEAVLRITNCIDCPYVDCQLEDFDGCSDVYCGILNEFLGEFKVKSLLMDSNGVPVPENCPLIEK